MLQSLFEFLQQLSIPGMDTLVRLFGYTSFRAAVAMLIALLISLLFGERFISYLKADINRLLGLAGEDKKAGTPTMGGILILTAILVPTLLLNDLSNVYVILLIVTTLWMGGIGFVDDYIKVFRRDKRGLAGRFKIIGQVILGLIVALMVALHPDAVVKESLPQQMEEDYFRASIVEVKPEIREGKTHNMAYYQTPVTNIPFVKAYRFDYSSIFRDLGFSKETQRIGGVIIYVLALIFIITAVSNATNLTDGIDGLATGLSAIALGCLAIFAYISSNVNLAEYLNLLYLPGTAEMVVFSASCVGACIGFLWFNAHPAQVFMGDTGSLALGGIIATIAIVLKKELLIPLLCGVFLIETLSVIIQVRYFKYTKKKYGEGRRIFLMSPLHHHYQKKGIHESKIVTRFWIVGILLAILTFVTLKLR